MNKLEQEIANREKTGRGKNFIHERLNHILKRDFIQFNDYMICLEALEQKFDNLSLDNIKYF